MFKKRTLKVGLLGSIAIAACATTQTKDDEQVSADELSIDNLKRLWRGTIDRSVVDPFNPWAQIKLGLGEEYILPGEAAEFTTFASQVRDFQREAQEKSGQSKLNRAFHAKSHACVRGELSLDPKELSADRRIGLFQNAENYVTYARFSNGGGDVQSDKKMDIRGLALKILGVKGTRILSRAGDETATTQDFLMGSTPFAPASDARHMMAFGVATNTAPNSKGILGRIESLVQVGRILTKDENVRIVDFLLNHALPGSKNVGSALGASFFTGAPNALGLQPGDINKVRAKGAFKLMAKTGVLKGDVCAPIVQAPSSDPDFLRTDLKSRFANSKVCVEVYAQFQRDGVTDAIEDVSVQWSSPFVRVGRVVFEPQDVNVETAGSKACNEFSFTPWHTIAEHRPLGNAMRARRTVLTSSAEFRGANMTEPTE